jgi:hypothetical protein
MKLQNVLMCLAVTGALVVVSGHPVVAQHMQSNHAATSAPLACSSLPMRTGGLDHSRFAVSA